MYLQFNSAARPYGDHVIKMVHRGIDELAANELEGK